MSVTKQQKERDKAIRHLFDYIDSSETWGPRVEQMTDHFMRPVVEYFDEPDSHMKLRLKNSPYGSMIYGYVMEMMAVTRWDDERVTPIDDYLKKRGWREGPHGRRYLIALNESELHFLEVTAVEPGRWVEVRPYGTNAQPERIVERSGSENLHIHDAIVARLVKLGKSHRFGSILPLSFQGAQHLKEQLDAVSDDLKTLYEEAVAEDGPEGLVKNFADDVPEERRLRIEETGFMCFAIDALEASSGGAPRLHNTDDERIVITKTRFPMLGDPQTIRAILDAQNDLFNVNETHWSWLKPDGSTTLLGSVTIDENHLTFESNSVERSERGTALIQACLDNDLIGAPMSVHESMDHRMATAPAANASSQPIDMAQHPELQGMMQEALKNQYLNALDEAIPMLDDESPRACASDPDKRHKAIDWIKYLENMESKSPNPAHDFTWMWEELGLSDYR